MDKVIDASLKTIEIITSSPVTTTLSLVGLALIALCGFFAFVAMRMNPSQVTTSLKLAFLLCLIGGIAFSAAGPGLALFWVTDGQSKVVTEDQILENLTLNTEVRWLVRLIAYDKLTDPSLNIDNVERLGPPKQIYSFVADYSELAGRTVQDAIQMTGGRFAAGQHVSAIIFPLQTKLYPANSRGLLQIIRDIESRGDTDIKVPFLKGTNRLNDDEVIDLNRTDIPSYRLDTDQKKTRNPHYCELAFTFKDSRSTFSAKDYIGEISDDWHPLGFSRRNRHIEDRKCDNQNCCQFENWSKVKTDWSGRFGSRVFLIRNLDINNISGKYLIDFNEPAKQHIPNILNR